MRLPTVLTYSENAELAGELSAAGAEVAAMLGSEAIAVELDQVSVGLSSESGVILVKGDRDLEADADSAAGALVEVAKAKGVRAVLVAETRFGTVVAAKVAARLRIASLGKGKKLRVEGERLVLTRDVYGGKFLASVGAMMPCVALVQPGAYPKLQGSPQRVETMRVNAEVPKIEILETRLSHQNEADIKSASRIVAAGRGFAKKEDLALARELADVLGAALGCSRPLASDLGWMGEEAHIGLTGAYVHPKLYVAVGVSGQLQHVAGIKDSKLIVAINNDKQAPIFQVADYGIVGDLYQVLPALTRTLRQH